MLTLAISVPVFFICAVQEKTLFIVTSEGVHEKLVTAKLISAIAVGIAKINNKANSKNIFLSIVYFFIAIFLCCA